MGIGKWRMERQTKETRGRGREEAGDTIKGKGERRNEAGEGKEAGKE